MTDRELVAEAIEAKKKIIFAVFRIYGRRGAPYGGRQGLQGL